jgi:hypothetical protein
MRFDNGASRNFQNPMYDTVGTSGFPAARVSDADADEDGYLDVTAAHNYQDSLV